MPDPAPGQEPAAFIAIVFVGLVIFVPLVIYLCAKVGIKPTLGLFTIGLRPRGTTVRNHMWTTPWALMAREAMIEVDRVEGRYAELFTLQAAGYN